MKVKLRALLAVGALLIGAAMVGVTPAQAATSVTLAPRSIPAPCTSKSSPALPDCDKPQSVVPVGSVSLNMAARQTAYVVAVMRANGATTRSLFDNEIVCRLPDGSSKNMVIGQNIQKAGTGIPAHPEDITLTTRYLVQTAVAGTVTCTANVRGASLGAAGAFLLHSGTLQFADPSVDNAANGQAIQSSVPAGGAVVSPSNRTVRLPEVPMFDLAAGFRGLSVFGDTEYQVCVLTTCPADASTTSTARFTLFVNQWKADRTLCQTNNSATVTKTMNRAIHHYYVPLHQPNFLIRTDSGCIPRFNAYVKVDWISGVEGAIQGTATSLNDTSTSSTTHRSDMSHAYVVPFH